MVDKLESIAEIEASFDRARAYLRSEGWPDDHGAIGYMAVTALLAGYERRSITPTEDARELVKVLEEALEAIVRYDATVPHLRYESAEAFLGGCVRHVQAIARTALGNKETDRHG